MHARIGDRRGVAAPLQGEFVVVDAARDVGGEHDLDVERLRGRDGPRAQAKCENEPSLKKAHRRLQADRDFEARLDPAARTDKAGPPPAAGIAGPGSRAPPAGGHGGTGLGEAGYNGGATRHARKRVAQGIGGPGFCACPPPGVAAGPASARPAT